jgi:predicted nucleic acid-binding protein
MILLDTNIVIYLRNNQLDEPTIDVLRGTTLATCNIVVAEVLGFRSIDREDAMYFSDLFKSMKNLDFDDAVTKKVVELRQLTSIKLPDAIIAATAVINGAELWTHNLDDFKTVPGLQVFDPLSAMK